MALAQEISGDFEDRFFRVVQDVHPGPVELFVFLMGGYWSNYTNFHLSQSDSVS